MFQSKLPKKVWSYAVLHPMLLLNRIPTKILNNKSSYVVLCGQAPDRSQLKVFGCLSYASTLPNKRQKFDPRAKKCAFLRYKTGMKGFILVYVNSSDILISRNVKFFDLEFPFHSSTMNPIPNTHIYIENRVHSFSNSNQNNEVNDEAEPNIEVDTYCFRS
jgi:hypothetical protein